MNKIFTVTLFYLLSFTGFTQTTITENNLPGIGDITENKLIRESTISYGAPGANIVRDFSNIYITDTISSFLVVNADTTEYASSFDANIAFYTAENPFYSYYKKNANTYTLAGTAYIGDGTSPMIMIYDDPMDMFRFPLNYLDTYTDTYEYSYTTSGYNFFTYGTFEVSVDAYGSIILPSGQLDNCIRVKTIRNDVNYNDMQQTDTSYTTTTSYHWFAEGQKGPIITINETETSMYTSHSAYLNVYQDNSSSANLINKKEDYAIYPNPFKESFIIERLPKNTTLQILNAEMQVIKEFKSKNNKEQLNLTNIPAGIYFVKIFTDNSVTTKKIIKQ